MHDLLVDMVGWRDGGNGLLTRISSTKSTAFSMRRKISVGLSFKGSRFDEKVATWKGTLIETV